MKTWAVWGSLALLGVITVGLAIGLKPQHQSPTGGRGRVPPATVGRLNAAGNSRIDSARKQQVFQNYGTLPIAFEPNVGQAESGVRYLSRGKRYTAILRDREVAFIFDKKSESQSLSSLRMELDGANLAREITAEGQLQGKTNYFIGRDPLEWHTNVPQYARVRYSRVYPGVDLAFYGTGGQLEFDFVIKPDADPSRIAFRLNGSAKPQLLAAGDLEISIPTGKLELHRPVAYQQIDGAKRVVDAKWVMGSGNRLRFQIGKYDHTRTLTIDPRIEYSTDLGIDLVASDHPVIALDAAGSIYIAGTAGASFPTTPGAFQTGGGVFVSKLSSDGSTLLYSTSIGGGQGVSLALNQTTGEAFVAGITDSASFPLTPNAYQNTLSLGGNTFFCKLSSDGSSLLYSTLLPETITNVSIAVDSLGFAYLTGISGPGLPTTGQSFAGGSSDAFVAKFDPTKSGSSSLDYLTYVGGSANDQGKAIAVDASGRAWVAGYTESADFPSVGAFQPSYGGNGDAFATLISADGATMLYSSLLGGSGLDAAQAIAVDASGLAYVSGSTNSTNFPVKNAYQLALAAGVDAFVTKIDSSQTGAASLSFSTYMGGSGDDAVNAIAVDSKQNVYVVGGSGSVDFPSVHPLLQKTSGGSAFVAEINSTGSPLLFSSPLNGADLGGRIGFGPASATAVAVDSNDNIIVGGEAYGSEEASDSQTDFPVTLGAFQTVMHVFSRFIVKIAADDSPSLAVTAGNLPFSATALKASSAQTFRIFDAATQPLAITNFSTTGDFAQTNTCSQSLAAGSNCSVTVTFSPTAVGNRTGTVTVTDNAAGSPHVISLSGLGLSDGIPFWSSNPNFGTIAVNSSFSQVVVLTNIGTGPFAINNISTSGDFSEINNCSPQLGVAASCSVRVTFTPTASGNRQGTLQVSTDASASATALALSGNAILAPGILSNPSALFFSQQAVATTSAPQTVTLTNNGSAPLNIVSISSAGDFAQTNNCVGSIQPAGNCTVSVTFSPTASGNRYGQITIDDNASGNPHMIPLTGGLSASSSTFALFPTSLPPSATITAGQSATYNLNVFATPDLTGVVTLSCTGAPAGASCSPAPATITVGPFSSSNTVTVTVKTTAPTTAYVYRLGLRNLSWFVVAFVPLLTFCQGPRGRWRTILTALLAIGLMACGGGGTGTSGPPIQGQQGTPAGTYSLTINGTYTTAITQTATLSLTVN